MVTTAAVPDRDGGTQVFVTADGILPRLKRIWSDRSYAGMLVEWVQQCFTFVMELVRRS